MDAEKLKQMREARKWSRREMVEWLGLANESHLSHFETGRRPIPDGVRARIALLRIEEEMAKRDTATAKWLVEVAREGLGRKKNA